MVTSAVAVLVRPDPGWWCRPIPRRWRGTGRPPSPPHPPVPGGDVLVPWRDVSVRHQVHVATAEQAEEAPIPAPASTSVTCWSLVRPVAVVVVIGCGSFPASTETRWRQSGSSGSARTSSMNFARSDRLIASPDNQAATFELRHHLVERDGIVRVPLRIGKAGGEGTAVPGRDLHVVRRIAGLLQQFVLGGSAWAVTRRAKASIRGPAGSARSACPGTHPPYEREGEQERQRELRGADRGRFALELTVLVQDHHPQLVAVRPARGMRSDLRRRDDRAGAPAR